MQLSMHAWQGWKHPSIPEFAAFTITSHSRVVMSPCQIAMVSEWSSSVPSVSPTVWMSFSLTIPLSAFLALRYLSWILSKLGDTGTGALMFIRDLTSILFSSESDGTLCTECAESEIRDPNNWSRYCSESHI